MRWKFAFGLASDDLFFVTTRRDRFDIAGSPVRSKVTTFLSEDEFLRHLIRADLAEQATTLLASAVLLSVAKPASPPDWTVVDLSQRQMEMLHLTALPDSERETDSSDAKNCYLQGARSGSLPQFYDLLMQAPTALSMVMGPRHVYRFMNDQYAKLIGIRSSANVLGTSVLDRYTGIHRQRLAEVLDRVYRTGESHVGMETPVSFFHETSGIFKQGHFNKVFQPITNAFGEVAGVMIQTTDVTDIVLGRSVQGAREQLLYSQWAELEAIYRGAAIALSVIDAKTYRIVRLNENQARIFGGTPAEFAGKPIFDHLKYPSRARTIFERVIVGETVGNEMIVRESAETPGVPRCWLSNFSPMFLPEGQVQAIIVVSLEITAAVRAKVECSPYAELVPAWSKPIARSISLPQKGHYLRASFTSPARVFG